MIAMEIVKEQTSAEYAENGPDLKLYNLEVIKALASDYTSLFYLDLSSGKVYLYSMSDSVSEKYKESFVKCDFEAAKKIYAERDIYPEDRELYYRNMTVDAISMHLRKFNSYSFMYRMISGNNYEYCEVKMIRVPDGNNGIKAAVIAYANVDERVRSEREQLRMLKEALHNAETDMLTGLLNRGGGEIKIRNLMSYDNSGVFMIFDIDSFKLINDRYGHQTGDLALKAIAAAISKVTKKSDVCVRLGGDEFVVFSPNIKDIEEGRILIEALFSEIAASSVEGLPGPMTVSVGYTLFPADETDSFDRVYSRVDSAMYEAKKAKGSCCVCC